LSREIANDGTIYWEFEIHVIEWWDRPVTRKVAVAIRNDSGEFSFGQDKFSRQRGGVNYRAHTRMAILPGDTITVVVSPLRNGEPAALLKQITLPDGTKYSNGGPAGPATIE
jgi:hypothetical protein